MVSKIRKIPRHSAASLIQPTHQAGDIIYPDAEILQRPLDPPRAAKSYAGKIMIIATVIAAFFLIWVCTTVITAPANEKAALEANLQRQVELNVPQLKVLMPLDDNSIVQTFLNQGDNIYTRVAPGTSEDGSFELIKLPPDLSVETAASLYLQGLESIKPSDFARLMNGSWVLDVYRDPTSMRIHYVDFNAGNAETALNAAMASQGISQEATTDAGVDDAGNTYRSGLMVTEDATYTWRVSAILLTEAFDVDSMPQTAFYVGIRFTS